MSYEPQKDEDFQLQAWSMIRAYEDAKKRHGPLRLDAGYYADNLVELLKEVLEHD